jgi:hypothetical protein
MGRAVSDKYTIEDAPVKPKYQVEGEQDALSKTLANMTAAQSGQKMGSAEEQAHFEAGKKEGIKSGAETIGGVIGGESVPVIRGVVGALARVLGTGAGAGAGNIAGQEITSGTVDPIDTLKAAGKWGAFQGGGELLGSIANLRSALTKFAYTGKLLADGTPELSTTAKSILHPTEMPENILRAAVPPPKSVLEAQAAARGEQFETEFQKQYADFTKAKEAGAAKIAEMTKAEEAARQKDLTDWAKLQTQQGSEASAAIRRQGILDLQASKNVPQPSSLPTTATATNAPLQQQTTLPAPAAGSQSFTGAIPQGNLTPFVSKFTPQTPSRIVTPDNPAPPINRTLVSYDAPTLVKMAKGGDIDALTELIRNPRGVDVASAVPNSRYLLEANRPTNIYGGPQR